MKNYYEILEVDKKASEEVIEKAYKTLAKKYHPDLQQVDKKTQYAEKMKILNEAFEILSNQTKRAKYDEKLRIQEQGEKTYQDVDVQDSYNIGYEIKFNHDVKYYLKFALYLAIIIFVCFLIYQIPFVKNYFQTLYNENLIFQAVIDIIKNTISAGF